jgi:hypothetical protein
VAKVECLGKKVTNKDCIHEEIKIRFNFGNSCYRAVQNLLPGRLLSKNVKIKYKKSIILPVVLYGCETWLFSLRKEHKLRVLRTGCLGEYLDLEGISDRWLEEIT